MTSGISNIGALMGFATAPGSTTLTRMPCVPSTEPSALPSMLMAPLVPQ